jgi:hypothetical protein
VNTISIKVKGLALLGMAATGLALCATNVSAFTGWSPTNTVEQVTFPTNGSLTFTDNKNNTVKCTSFTNGGNNTYAKALSTSPTIANTVDVNGNQAAPQFSGCSSSLGGTVTVSCSTSWKLTATSTTSVDASNVACTISIATIFGTCTITSGTSTNPISVTGNTWSNSTSQLTANSTSQFNISESPSGFPCDGATSAHESGTVQLPTSVQIV